MPGTVVRQDEREIETQTLKGPSLTLWVGVSTDSIAVENCLEISCTVINMYTLAC